MKRYPKYKDSGVEWIGEIPVGWDIYRIKNLVNPYKYYQVGDGDHGSIKPEIYQEEGIPYIRVQNLSWGFELNWEGMVFLPEEVHKANLKSRLIPEDILIAKTGATIGKTAIIPKSLSDANTTSSVGKLTVDKEKFHYKYVGYCFLSKQFNDQIWQDASQKSAQPGFNVDQLIFYKIVSPQLSEQQSIANYLDHKTHQIDTLIEKKQKQIDLLKEQRTAIINHAVTKGLNPNVKMKDSGIEWLGEIPAHWDVKKIKYVLRLSRGVDLSRENFSKGIYPVYGSNGIIGYHNKHTTKGPCVTVGRSGSVGEVNFVEKDFWAHNTTLYVMKSYGNDIEFIHFLLLSFDLKSLSAGSAVGTLNRNYIHNEYTVCPSKKEQASIVIFIKTETLRIDSFISKIQEVIKKLTEYRTALISDAVTGKIDVRDEVPS